MSERCQGYKGFIRDLGLGFRASGAFRILAYAGFRLKI